MASNSKSFWIHIVNLKTKEVEYLTFSKCDLGPQIPLKSHCDPIGQGECNTWHAWDVTNGSLCDVLEKEIAIVVK